MLQKQIFILLQKLTKKPIRFSTDSLFQQSKTCTVFEVYARKLLQYSAETITTRNFNSNCIVTRNRKLCMQPSFYCGTEIGKKKTKYI